MNLYSANQGFFNRFGNLGFYVTNEDKTECVSYVHKNKRIVDKFEIAIQNTTACVSNEYSDIDSATFLDGKPANFTDSAWMDVLESLGVDVEEYVLELQESANGNNNLRVFELLSKAL